jgi:formylglycine-generating enzyme required for sulfatase activity
MYYRTYNTGQATDGGPPDGGWPDLADPATVSGFRLDKYLVTVGRFRQFVNAVVTPDGGVSWYPPAGSGKHTHLNGGQGLVNAGAPADAGVVYETGWQTSDNGSLQLGSGNPTLNCGPSATWTSTASTQENLPINCLTWWQSYEFCIWDGGFLPSEAEWEYAAAGGSQQREYPWGSTAPGTSNQYAIYNSYYTTTSQGLAPVGTATLGAGLWGQLDLAGQAWEWNLDWNAPYAHPCTDCANLTYPPPAMIYRVARGGAFWISGTNLLPSYRNVIVPWATYADYGGTRCARTP